MAVGFGCVGAGRGQFDGAGAVEPVGIGASQPAGKRERGNAAAARRRGLLWILWRDRRGDSIRQLLAPGALHPAHGCVSGVRHLRRAVHRKHCAWADDAQRFDPRNPTDRWSTTADSRGRQNLAGLPLPVSSQGPIRLLDLLLLLLLGLHRSVTLYLGLLLILHLLVFLGRRPAIALHFTLLLGLLGVV